MPRLNRVFEEIKAMYGDRKIPDKVLKSIEDKAARASKSVVAPVAMARAEYKKRKEIDAPKAVAKKRKMAKNAEDVAEEVAESTHNESEAACPIIDAGQSEASIARMDKDLMASSVKATAIVLGAGASSVELLPCILGDDLSEFEGNAGGLCIHFHQ